MVATVTRSSTSGFPSLLEVGFKDNLDPQFVISKSETMLPIQGKSSFSFAIPFPAQYPSPRVL